MTDAASGPELRLYSPAAERDAFEQALRVRPSVAARLRLAWALRQSDAARAAALLDGLRDGLSKSSPPLGREAEIAALRVRLIAAEQAVLGSQVAQAQVAQAQVLAELALAFCAAGDPLGSADAEWISHRLATLVWDRVLMQRHLGAALAFAEQAGDTERLLIFQAESLRQLAFADLAAAEPAAADLLALEPAHQSPAAAAALSDLRGVLASLRGDYPSCLREYEAAFHAALDTGQQRRAIVLASNLGFNAASSGDTATAMHWLQLSLGLARAAGWPMLIGGTLMHIGDLLWRLDQRSAAREHLQEALGHLQQMPSSRNHGSTLNLLARLALEEQDFAEALRLYAAMGDCAAATAADLHTLRGLGRSRALIGLARAAEALALAEETLAFVRAQGHTSYEVEALWVRAEALQCLQPQGAGALADFEQALSLAQTPGAGAAPVALLDAASRAHAAQGHFERAYALATTAAAQRERDFSEDNAKRLAALKAQHQLETARTENLHLRRVAELEAARYAVLRDNHELLLRLGEVGQEIARELQPQGIYDALAAQVHKLLPADSVALYVRDETGTRLDFAFGQELGERFTDPPLALDDPSSYCARCVREGLEFVVGDAIPIDPRNEVPGSIFMASMMFMPVRAGERIAGAMTVQCVAPQAYGEREQLIFRMLCAYGAIALENARAWARLSRLQQHLMAQEKHAALGALVAGVAHELGTPIGNCVLVASTLAQSAQGVQRALDERTPLKRSELLGFVAQHSEGLAVIEQSMATAAGLVRSFKEVAVDRSAELRREFDLAELCAQTGGALRVALRRAGVELVLEVPPGLRLDGYPGALSQVLMILLQNALTHAFEPGQGGQLTLGAAASDAEHLRLWLQDSGRGMPEAVRARVFEPFFTTRLGQGGSGLGLSIGHAITSGLLGGQLEVASTLGAGSRFTLNLPRVAPLAAQSAPTPSAEPA